MASKIDVSALTINTEEASEIGAAILEKEFVNGLLSEYHNIETGIEHDTQIVFAGKIADGLKVVSGCTPNAGGNLVLTEKKWEPKKYDVRFTHCASDMSALLKLFKKAQRVNPDFFDRVDSEELGLVASRVIMMLRDTLPEKIWFSDTAAAVHGSGGVFTTGVDVDLYNVQDGLFKQVIAAINSGDDNYVEISENAGANYAAQVLATDKALAILTSMRKAADERLLDDPEAAFYVTRSIAENYRDSIRTKTLGAGFVERTENGTNQLFFDGIPVKVMNFWDRFIKANQDNTTKYNLPNRALLTTPENIPVGTLSEDDFEALDSFYDKTLKSNIMDVALSLDMKFLEGYMAVAAY